MEQHVKGCKRQPYGQPVVHAWHGASQIICSDLRFASSVGYEGGFVLKAFQLQYIEPTCTSLTAAALCFPFTIWNKEAGYFHEGISRFSWCAHQAKL